MKTEKISGGYHENLPFQHKKPLSKIEQLVSSIGITTLAGVAVGGGIGSLVGIVGAPVGAILGAGVAFVGSLITWLCLPFLFPDKEKTEKSTVSLSQISPLDGEKQLYAHNLFHLMQGTNGWPSWIDQTGMTLNDFFKIDELEKLNLIFASFQNQKMETSFQQTIPPTLIPKNSSAVLVAGLIVSFMKAMEFEDKLPYEQEDGGVNFDKTIFNKEEQLILKTFIDSLYKLHESQLEKSSEKNIHKIIAMVVFNRLNIDSITENEEAQGKHLAELFRTPKT